MKRLFFLALATLALAQPMRLVGQVVRVVDGDTVIVRLSQGEQSVRLDSIDAPELHQAGGPESRRALERSLPPGCEVRVSQLGVDRYRRILGQLYRPDGANVNVLQVRNGQAWVFTRYCRDFPFWTPLENRARQEKLGLWSHPDPLPPWQYRHPHRQP